MVTNLTIKTPCVAFTMSGRRGRHGLLSQNWNRKFRFGIGRNTVKSHRQACCVLSDHSSGVYDRKFGQDAAMRSCASATRFTLPIAPPEYSRLRPPVGTRPTNRKRCAVYAHKTSADGGAVTSEVRDVTRATSSWLTPPLLNQLALTSSLSPHHSV